MGWWYDRVSTEQTLKFKEIFDVTTFVETGTYKGVNLKFWAHYFPEVYGCEINDEYFKITAERTKFFKNVLLTKQSSPTFLSSFKQHYRMRSRNDYIIFYLDAHFYDKDAEEKFVILRELEALEGFNEAIIIIHDFKVEGLGHIEYDGVPLDFNLVKDRLQKVNPNFTYYTNSPDYCDPHTKFSAEKTYGIEMDEDTLDVLNYHNTDKLKKRGILYCIPPIEMRGLEEYNVNK